MKSHLLCFLFYAGALASAAGTGSLRGTVMDPTGAPIGEARVSLTERDSGVRRSTVASPSGEYNFEALPAGSYLLEALASDVGSSEPVHVEVQENRTATVRIPVSIARLTTQVQVTAAGFAQTVDEQSKAVDIIDAQQLEARAEFSVAEALRTVPGVRVGQLGGPGSLTRVLTRGMRATDTSFLIDGFRLRDAASPQGDATAFISDLLTTDTDRIEVLRGSGSSLYGTHATGGVINIITDQGSDVWRGEVSAEGGGLGLFRGTGRFSGGTLGNRLHFSGGVTHLNVTRGVDGDDRARNTTGHGFVQFQLAPGTVVTGRLLAVDAFAGLNDTPYGTSNLPAGARVKAVPNVTFIPAPNDPDQRRAALQYNVMTALSHNWSSRASIRLSYSGVTTRRTNLDGPAGVRFEPLFNNSSQFDGRIDTVQARADVQIDRRHSLSGGYEFERETFDNLSTDQNPIAAQRTNARLKIDQSSHAAFGQVQGRYIEGRLQLLASGRVQHFDLSRPQFSVPNSLYQTIPSGSPPAAVTGDGSISYMMPRTSTKIRAHVGNGYRAPALYERFGASFFAGSFSAYGDPQLRPERLLAVDAGLDQYVANSRVRVSATYFYTRIQEAIAFDFSGLINPATDPYGRFGGYRNTRGGLARGVELSTEANPLRTLTLRGAWTFTNARDRASQYGNGILESPRISRHMFTATASQRLGRRIDVTFDMFAASSYLFPLAGRAFEFEGPVKADLVASWTKPLTERQSLRIFTRIENILNRTFYEEGFRTPAAWAVAGVKWAF